MSFHKSLKAAAAILAVGSLALMGGCSSSDEPAADDTASTPAAEAPADETSEAPADEETSEAPADEAEAAPCTVADGDLIGVAMPWVGTQNWKEAVDRFGPALEAAGYQAQVLSADNKAEQQQQQIDTLVASGAKVLVVGAVDGTKLGSVLPNAQAAGICILGYDRLIQETDAVDGVVQYGAIETGRIQGQALLDGLAALAGDAPYTIELFAGGPADPNAKFFFDGAMEILQPEIDAGNIVVGSGQVDFTEVAIADWDNAKAQTRMDSLVTANYQSEPPDGVLAPNDGIARAILTSLENAGYDPSTIAIDGLDAEDESIQWIKDGKQYSTTAKPTDPMIAEVIRIIDAIKADGVLPAPTSVTDNGVKEVGLYELQPTVITKDNVEEYFPS
jgi:putative multiple sugar transport system substrate-binding protein